MLVAETFIRTFRPSDSDKLRCTRYRCYLGLEELATVISVGGHPVMVVSGQFLSPQGKDEILGLINCFGKDAPDLSRFSAQYRDSALIFKYPPELWTSVTFTDAERQMLQNHVNTLVPVPSGFEMRFLDEAKRIQQIATHYFELGKARVEAHISARLHASLMRAIEKTASLWTIVESTLQDLNKAFSVAYSAFFCGPSETETLLTVHATAGNLPQDKSVFPHFNWRKAGLIALSTGDPQREVLHHADVDFSHVERLQHGFRGPRNPFQNARVIVPVMLPQGPYGVLVLGPHSKKINTAGHDPFLLQAVRSLATGILPLHLSTILQVDREDWRRTAKLTGHRVRASIQNINSQISTIQAVAASKPSFTQDDMAAARKDLTKAFVDLTEVSYATESDIHGALDVRSAHRVHIPLGEVVQAAMESQADVAEYHHIEMVPKNLDLLGRVWVNETLLRFAFINIINNGLKYSLTRPGEIHSVLRIELSEGYSNITTTALDITNFGFGIKEQDYSCIFDWGTRLLDGIKGLEERYGKGIGLWEVKRIIEGHGGTIHVRSQHRTGGPVTNDNIQQCQTTFTICLKRSPETT
jgi:signal transduction histidine kinase